MTQTTAGRTDKFEVDGMTCGSRARVSVVPNSLRLRRFS